MSEKERQKGYIQIYCSDGKGKTTAAVGQCVRAAGSGFKVLFCQFLKANNSGEIEILRKVPGVTILEGPPKMKFTVDMTAEEKKLVKETNEQRFQKVVNIAEDFDMIILDEIIYAIAAGLFEEELLTGFLGGKPYHAEVILTGQNPSERLIALAGYVSEIKKIKHPYDAGQKSRRGIEK